MTYPERWTNKIPAGRTWYSPDGTTCAWRVDGNLYHIQTTDTDRVRRLERLSRVREFGHAVVGGPLAIYRLDAAKMNTKAVRNMLHIDRFLGPNSPSKASEPAGPGAASS